MEKVIFSIQIIKQLYPELNRYFGFTYEDISYELGQVYPRKLNQLTAEQEELANQCKSEDSWGIDIVKFALSINEDIHIRVTDDFLDNLRSFNMIRNNYNIAELKNGNDIGFILLFIAIIFNRDLNNLLDNTEYTNVQEDYNRYTYKIRPDMLKLYIALRQKKHQINDKLKISIQGNSPTELENYECWFEEMLKNYLNQYLGINNEEEALAELETMYSDKQGRKTDNFYLNYIFTSMFLFVQENIIHSEVNKVTIEQCRFLHSYLTNFNFIKPEDKNNNLNNLQSTIKSLISSNLNPLDKYKLGKEYKASPNNKGCELY